MINRSFAITGLLALTASSFAMQGNMTWVSGTLGSAVTVAKTPLTINLQVGSATDIFPDTYVTGVPGTVLPVGTPMEFLKQGSTPFTGNYNNASNLNVPVYNPSEGKSAAFRRSVPMSTSGVLSYSIATTSSATGSGLTLYMPQCFEDGVNYSNGLTLNLSAEIANYFMPIPNSNSSNFNTFFFPGNAVPLNTVNFTCFGDGQLHFEGSSSSAVIEVVGTLTGSLTTLSSATLTFNSGT